MADSHRWKKRILRLGPILGISALVLAVGCVALAWYTLKYFDGKLIIDYPYINTYLSITSSVAATLIRFAIGGGLAIHWWRKALSALQRRTSASSLEGWNELLGGHQNAKRIRSSGYRYNSKDPVDRCRPNASALC
jgi:hypothetical protein